MKEHLRILFAALSLCLLMLACTNSPEYTAKDYFENRNWYKGDQLILQGSKAFSYCSYDTATQSFSNDSLFPIHYTDSTLTYTHYATKGYYNKQQEYQITFLEKNVEEVYYDFKYINNKPCLILYREPFPLILSTNEALNLPETHNHQSIKFIISDYSIGDQIDRTLLKTRGVYHYKDYTIEDCEYIKNKDITIKLIGYNTIYAIERKNIEHFRVQDIVSVVSNKLHLEPDYRPMRQWVNNSDHAYEFYRWNGSGVQINLSRSRYIGKESYKKLVDKNNWTLSYDDSFLQALLVETYKNGKKESSIIN